MGIMLEIEVPQEVFSRRIQPFGIALAEVSWRVKMFTHDGVVLAALHLEEPNLIVALSFWPRAEDARLHFKGAFEICLYTADGPDGGVRLDVQLDAATVEELFMAAKLINPHPGRTSARCAEQHFTNFLNASFPNTLVTWARTHQWLQEPLMAESGVPVRVG
ncbi:MAG TPA: hypothetical protein VKK81_00645 [Candidatus Binatia bacterium]|nr:hypothetical protein [Candidatus Binatia bacterium]